MTKKKNREEENGPDVPSATAEPGNPAAVASADAVVGEGAAVPGDPGEQPILADKSDLSPSGNRIIYREGKAFEVVRRKVTKEGGVEETQEIQIPYFPPKPASHPRATWIIRLDSKGGARSAPFEIEFDADSITDALSAYFGAVDDPKATLNKRVEGLEIVSVQFKRWL